MLFLAGCQKKRDLGDDDGNNVEESLVESVPKVELNGEHVSWESLISPSRVILTLDVYRLLLFITQKYHMTISNFLKHHMNVQVWKWNSFR